MSYGVSAYTVDLDRLVGAIGSHELDLAAQVRERSIDRIESYELSDTPGQLGRAIDRLIDGDFGNLGDLQTHDLGYALECLAAFLSGREIYGTDALKSISGGWLYNQPELKELVGGKPARLAQKMPLPDDFPGIHIVPFDELTAKIDALKAMGDTPDIDLRDGRADYRHFLETARDTGRALITFYY